MSDQSEPGIVESRDLRGLCVLRAVIDDKELEIAETLLQDTERPMKRSRL
jgi:hypothetical protein